MFFVDHRSPKPLYEQIKDSIRSQMARGVLQPDDRLPSVRELAQSAAINPNTIQKAYRDLEAEGFVYSVPGKGSFVAVPPQDLRQRRIEEIIRVIQPLSAELQFLGMGPDALCKRLQEGMKDDD